MKKAVAIQAVFLIAVIMIFLFFIAAVFFQWIDISKIVNKEAACRMKIINYCSEWRKSDWSKQPDWSKKPVENCTQVPSREECQETLT